MHGYGETQTAIYADPVKASVITALINAGFIVAGSNEGGLDWGSTTGQTCLSSLRSLIATAGYSFPSTQVLSESMGGINGLLTLLNNSWATSWYGFFPVCSLSWAYNSGSSEFLSDINTAYNIPAGDTYAVQTAGHDPCLYAASAFTGKRLRCIASYSDLTVVRASNDDVLRAALRIDRQPDERADLDRCAR